GRQVRAWERGHRDPGTVVAAWTALATLPFEYVRQVRKYPFVLGYLPFMAFTTWYLHIEWYGFFILTLAGTVVLATSLIVRYFTIEIVSRPVLEELAKDLPPDFPIEAPGLPLRAPLPVLPPRFNR